MNPTQNSRAAQEFVPIKEIRKDTLILKDGGYRSIIMTSSLNIALKSEDERTGILLQFQSFLNSLDFSVQFFVQSREIDIRPYITLLEEQFTNQEVDLIKIQTREYINFVKGFTETVNIMKKTFFIVIPYYPTAIGQSAGLLGGFFGSKKNTASLDFEENISQLAQRTDVVINGIASLGLRSKRLETDELIEVFYKIFHPSDVGGSAKGNLQGEKEEKK